MVANHSNDNVKPVREFTDYTLQMGSLLSKITTGFKQLKIQDDMVVAVVF